jgi:hypothetical protein
VKPPHISNQQTNWDLFRHLITERLTLKIPLKTPEDIEEAVKLFNDTVQGAVWTATPNPPAQLHTHGPPLIRQRLEEKRQLRKRWQHTKTPENKRLLNRAIRDLKQLLHRHRNDCVQTFLQSLTPNVSIDYSLRPETRHETFPSSPNAHARTHTPARARARTHTHTESIFCSH